MTFVHKIMIKAKQTLTAVLAVPLVSISARSEQAADSKLQRLVSLAPSVTDPIRSELVEG